jgi:uncharacterized protein (DUF1684 family)
MIRITFILLVALTAFGCNQENKNSYNDDISQFHYKLNVEFSDKKTSPLKSEDFTDFKQLSFFPINETFKIVAHFKRTPNKPIFEMQTTTERKPRYTQYGIASFNIDGKECSLRIYQNQELVVDPEYTDYLFIPFNDLTNGDETYDAGRYIDLKVPDGDSITIDFNKAYNPYCAYNDKYSCPLPPRENDLAVKIKAGILNFNKH